MLCLGSMLEAHHDLGILIKFVSLTVFLHRRGGFIVESYSLGRSRGKFAGWVIFYVLLVVFYSHSLLLQRVG